MWDLVVFALIGLLTGAAARLAYPGRESIRILGTLLLGAVGAVLGGLLSWTMWPSVVGQLSYGALLTSLLGAVLVLVLWPCAVYVRRLNLPQDSVP